MKDLIHYFPLFFLLICSGLILTIKPRQYQYDEPGYLSTLPLRLVIAAYAATPFAFVKLLNDNQLTLLTVMALCLPPLMLISGAGTAIAFRECKFRKTSLTLATIYILTPCFMKLSGLQFFIMP